MNNQSLLEKNAALQNELLVKNRELEIEAALEKVRAIALGMKKPADMLAVCKIIFKQLESLQKQICSNVSEMYLNFLTAGFWILNPPSNRQGSKD